MNATPHAQSLTGRNKTARQSKPNSTAGSDRARVDPELEALADWLDTVFHIPGIGLRFGLDAILGLIPGIGDAFTSLASLYILHAATRYGVPRVTILRMGLNVAIDFLMGAVPVVGDAKLRIRIAAFGRAQKLPKRAAALPACENAKHRDPSHKARCGGAPPRRGRAHP